MNKNLQDYIQRTEFISHEEADKVVTTLDTETIWKPYPYDDKNYNICVQEYPEIPYLVTALNPHHDTSKFLAAKVDIIIDNYINEFLHDAFWFTEWNNKSHFHYIKYPTNTGMETHCDHVRHTFDGVQRGIPILSIIGTFNGDYKGGELLFLPDTKIRLNKGEVVIFPSNFLYPHKLLEITEGVRYSFIVWVW